MTSMRTYLDIINEQNRQVVSEIDWKKTARDIGIGIAGAAAVGGALGHAYDDERHHRNAQDSVDQYEAPLMHPGIEDDHHVDESLQESEEEKGNHTLAGLIARFGAAVVAGAALAGLSAIAGSGNNHSPLDRDGPHAAPYHGDTYTTNGSPDDSRPAVQEGATRRRRR